MVVTFLAFCSNCENKRHNAECKFKDNEASRLAKHGTVYTKRHEINVIVPGTGYRGEGNHTMNRPSGAVVSWLPRTIHKVLQDENIECLKNGYEITIRQCIIQRGMYWYMVWN